ncbi:MAG: MFS transporter, partial [Micrococcales bacterium]
MTHRQIMMVLFGLMSGMFLSSLDQSIVGSAMRTIADDLKGLDLQAWVTTAYLITSTITTPIYGKLGDIFGRRRLFIFAIGVFVLASVGASFSHSMYELATWRAIQGIGAGGLFSLSITILADVVPPRERAKYQGMFLAVFGTSSVIGPVVGGLFAGANQILWLSGWRWVFLINIPIGIAAMMMVVAFLHIPHHPVKARIDWAGAVTIVLGVVPLLIVAEQGRN